MISETVGPKVLITRSHEGNTELAEKLRARGFEPLILDLLELSPPESWSSIDRRLRAAGDYDWIVITSPTGARIFAQRARELEVQAGLAVPKIAAVGAKTAAALTANGWRADFVPSRYTTEALGEELPQVGRVLLLRPDAAANQMAERLRERGFQVDEEVIYRTVRRELGNLDLVRDANIVIFGSPSAVEALCSQVPEDSLALLLGKAAACIGPVTAKAARRRGFTEIIQCGSRYTFDALIEEIEREYNVA